MSVQHNMLMRQAVCAGSICCSAAPGSSKVSSFSPCSFGDVFTSVSLPKHCTAPPMTPNNNSKCHVTLTTRQPAALQLLSPHAVSCDIPCTAAFEDFLSTTQHRP
jgi:hypothetical protein